MAGVCTAPQTPPEPSILERDSLAAEYLAARLALWQERLHLGDWAIKLVQSRPEELRRGTLGNIHWNAADRTARIRVLAAAEYQTPYHAALRDMEFTLVHALIHLELASLPRSDASRSEEEYAVNHMTEALLALDRNE